MAFRGEVWKVDLEPTKGTEIRKERFCVIISTNQLNKWDVRFIVAPMTSKKLDKFYAFEVPVFFNGLRGKAICDQIRTVDKNRLKRKIGVLTSSEMDAIQEKLLAIFDLWKYLVEKEDLIS